MPVPSVSSDDRELRLAVVMTGGVSLAVWIGGVASEVYRALQGEGLYGHLARLTRTRLSVDVITGASAGGINGAFLAAAAAYRPATDQLDGLRNVWGTAGSIDRLLRDPREKNPPSLLRGDEYFYAQLRTNLASWVGRGVPDPVDGEPTWLRLVMTATTLQPDRRTFRDDLGTIIVEPQHRARFTFSDDDFRGAAAQDRRSVLVEQLALAARATASFPGAFEPAFIPIGAPCKVGATTFPDMADVASFPTSRWVVDGGVLVNKPVRAALEAIYERPSASEIRRVLFYVNPDPSDSSAPDSSASPATSAGLEVAAAQTSADDPAVVPTLSEVIYKSLIGLPRTETVAGDLEEIRAVNLRRRAQTQTRAALLLGVRNRDSTEDVGGAAVWRVDRIDLEAVATLVYPAWLRQRSYQAVQHRLGQLDPRGGPPRSGSVPPYTWGEFADELRLARGRLGWLSSEFPRAGDPPVRTPADPTPAVDLVGAGSWRFGLQPLEYAISVVFDLVNRAYRQLPLARPAGVDPARLDADDVVTGLRTRLGELRRRVHRQRELIGLLRWVDDEFWAAELHKPTWPVDQRIGARADAVLGAWPLPTDGLAHAARVGRQHMADAVRRQRWSQAIALWTHANDEGDWDAVVKQVLDSPTSMHWPTNADILAGLGSDAGDGHAAVARASRRAEQRIAEQLAGLLAEHAELFYAVADRRLEAGWRRAVEVGTGDNWANLDGLPAPVDGDEALPLPDEAALLAAMTGELTGVRPATLSRTRQSAHILRRLLALHIVHGMVDNELQTRELAVDFVQVSADNPSPIAGNLSAADKVAGLKFFHFGGFLKESWRINDWMWGALDGSARLTDVLLDPARLRQCFPGTVEGRDLAVELLLALACGRSGPGEQPVTGLDSADCDWLAQRADETGLRRSFTADLEFIARPKMSLAGVRIPAVREAIGLVVQLLVARRELPEVAMAIRYSSRDQARESLDAAKFLARMSDYVPRGLPERPVAEVDREATLDESPPIPLAKVAQLLRTCPIAAEQLSDEVGSDALTATTATAAAVVGNLMTSRRSGLGLVRTPLRAVRYGLLGGHYLARSTIGSTRTSAGFRNLLLALSGTFVAFLAVGWKMPPGLGAAALAGLALWLLLAGRAVASSWRGAVAVAPAALVAVLAAATSVTESRAAAFLTDEPVNSMAQSKRALFALGLALAAVAAITELIREILRRRAGNPLARGVRHSHAVHASYWVGGGAVWWWGWGRVTRGADDGGRGWLIDRFGDFHHVQPLLVLAVPAALIGVDLILGWAKGRDLAARRHRAARLAAKEPEL